ncbi:Membrane-bound lytic murein transglycosylase A precursor [Myxococcus hansupus]|uniref:peptidoglycan lytic exotransglycosylase n=1 Tax=Pseudomyxococcus hansupus TaxID=1297742 RepID=A0A0H4XPL2_9BACT|nr:MltA domain-containing protein [Myxococcus hansupus]AKQ70312.1 Membrane-bound lytic murein transglycosylase A precursor [Myxococcus hansupus]
MDLRHLRILLLSALGLFASACPSPTRAPVTRPEDALLGLARKMEPRDDGDVESLRTAVAESLVWLRSRPSDTRFIYGARQVTLAELRTALERLHARLQSNLTPEQLWAVVLEDFEPLEAAGGEDGQVLFTGYYEPTIEASLTRTAEYTVPIHAAPSDLIEVPLEPFAERFKAERVFGRLDGRKVVPYWSRGDIRGGRLDGRKLELAWAKDPVALFFLEVQGSGSLQLPDGTRRRLGYAASNGRPYRSIGSLLIQEGAIPKEEMSMQALRAWLAANPQQRTRVLEHNESYVFFRFLNTASVGSLGRPVTAGRSIATDARLFPKGGLAFIHTERPVRMADGSVQWKPLARFVLNQDTGGAIKGAGRVDVFWGAGPQAELAAGMMKQKGRLLFLVPRPGRAAPLIAPQPLTSAP